jgi:hypothetical protein
MGTPLKMLRQGAIDTFNQHIHLMPKAMRTFSGRQSHVFTSAHKMVFFYA